MMLHASLALARRVDLAEIGFCALASRAGHPGGARQLLAGGGLALCGKAGSPFNKVLGLGLGTDVSDDDLDSIDAFYDDTAEPAQIELCPLAPASLAGRLAARGYAPKGLENQLVWSVGHLPHSMMSTAVDIAVAPVGSATDDETWVRVVSAGFAAGEGHAGPTDESVLRQITDVMRDFGHPTMTRYLASIRNQPVGGGAVYVIDGVAGLTGTATLPSFRGRGVQHAVVFRMLRDLDGRADLATATTEPGSRSQRTFERFGFQVVYTRSIWVRAFTAGS
jgi:hypothetical protein